MTPDGGLDVGGRDQHIDFNNRCLSHLRRCSRMGVATRLIEEKIGCRAIGKARGHGKLLIALHD
jgi:hypothetical protein